MPYYYTAKFIVLVGYRLYSYTQQRAQLYLLDFCCKLQCQLSRRASIIISSYRYYLRLLLSSSSSPPQQPVFTYATITHTHTHTSQLPPSPSLLWFPTSDYANILFIIYLYAFPSSPLLFQVVFAVNNGPLLWAVFTFRNSLVFHSLDKITSCLIHITPCIVTWCLRWRVGAGSTSPLTGGASMHNTDHLTHSPVTWVTCGGNGTAFSASQGFIATPDGCPWSPTYLLAVPLAIYIVRRRACLFLYTLSLSMFLLLT